MSTKRRASEELSVGAYLIQFSVVISGETHNPTILNPDFLAVRNIVPSEWGWDTSQVVTTPTDCRSLLNPVSFKSSMPDPR
jgi:hypothetical protein